MNDIDRWIYFDGPEPEQIRPLLDALRDLSPATPQDESADIKFAAKGMEYWGQVPVRVRIKGTEFTTALFPKDGRYLLPLKDVVRKSAGIEVGQLVTVAMSVGRP